VSNLKLVPDDPTPLEKILLDASRAEQPSLEHKAKLRAALGIGLPLSVPPPVSTTSPVQPAASSPAAAAAAPTSTLAKSAAAAKVALGLAGLALVGAFALTRQKDAPLPAPVAAPVVAQPVEAPAPAALPQPEAQPEVSPLPPVEQPAAPGRTTRSDSSASSAADLSEQIRLIEAARAGVAAHDGRAALSALDSYAAKYPRGSFGQEATVLRIRAVDQSGDSARASAMAKSFVARFPNSPHVARLKPIAERGASR
jgi:hypothetical protein